MNTEVVSISQGTSSSPNPSVTLANGEVLSADLLIGADGTKSMVRDAAFPNEIYVKPSGLTVYTGVVSREDMLKDEELQPLVLSEETVSTTRESFHAVRDEMGEAVANLVG